MCRNLLPSPLSGSEQGHGLITLLSESPRHQLKGRVIRFTETPQGPRTSDRRQIHTNINYLVQLQIDRRKHADSAQLRTGPAVFTVTFVDDESEPPSRHFH